MCEPIVGMIYGLDPSLCIHANAYRAAGYVVLVAYLKMSLFRRKKVNALDPPVICVYFVTSKQQSEPLLQVRNTL